LSARGARRVTAAATVAVCLSTYGCSTVAVEHDRWTGRDKAEHFFTSMAIAAGYMRAAGNPDHAARSRHEAVALVVSLGTLKELNDARVPGKGWSWRDMAWNVAGAVIGARLEDSDGP
jgi:putative lipoprotein